MRADKILLFLFLVAPYLSVAQGIESHSVKDEKKSIDFSVPDEQLMKEYNDSLSRIYNEELLTACIFSTLHENITNVSIECSINNGKIVRPSLDKMGRFFLTSTIKIQEVHIRVDDKDYFLYDSIFLVNNKEESIRIELEPKYKIMLRGRINNAGNLPIEGVDVRIEHNSDKYNLVTLGCYTDDENYWNCLYLGMFKQTISFENPDDSLHISFQKEGFKDQSFFMKVKDYDGTIVFYKLKYASSLVDFPKHNVCLNFGTALNNTWSVGFNYTYQLELGSFNRLGIGADATMIIDNIETEMSTFENMPDVQAQTSYTIGMVGPLVNFSITKPTNRLFNIYAGVVAPYTFPESRLTIQPYLAGKLYLDLNKAFFWQIKYIDYTINEVEYVFNPYGMANEIKQIKDYQKILGNIGLLISF